MTRSLLVIMSIVLLAGCLSTGSSVPPPDERFGHRWEDDAPDGRRTLVIAPGDAEVDYLIGPAAFDTVHVRFGAASLDPVPVEVLVKGAFPDGCTELHRVGQVRSGNILDVTLEMRRPRGALCASVMRPYRFYLVLEGTYAPGPYTLKINGRARPFEVPRPRIQS